MAPTSNGRISWEKVKKVTFDHLGNWQQPIPMANVTTVSGQFFKVPAEMIMFKEVVSGGDSTARIRYELGLETGLGNLLPFNKIRHFEVNANSTMNNTSVRITTADGNVFETVMKDEPYYYDSIYGLNRFGVFGLRIHDELKSISFEWG